MTAQQALKEAVDSGAVKWLKRAWPPILLGISLSAMLGIFAIYGESRHWLTKVVFGVFYLSAITAALKLEVEK